MRPRRLALGLILLLALALRLWNVADNPGWYTDEGTHLSLAQNLLAGRTQYLAITGSTLLFSRLPLFEYLLAVPLAAVGPANGILALRLLTGTLGVAATALLYLVAARLTRSTALALIAAAAYALYPPAVLYSRFGFSYNLLAPLLLLALWGAAEYLACQTRENPRAAAPWLVLSAIAIGLGAVSDLWMWSMLLPFLIVIALGRPRDALWALPLLALPFALYVLTMLATAPAAFVFDAAFAANRLRGADLSAQISLLLENLTTLVWPDPWVALSLLGLLALRPARMRALACLWFWAPFILLGRTVPLFSLSYYYLIPLLPLAMLGLAAGLHRLYAAFGQLAPRRPQIARALRAALGLLAAAAALNALWRGARSAQSGYTTAIDPFLIAPAEARAAAEYANTHTSPTDVTLASPAVAWLLHGRAADFQMALAYTNRATPHLPANLPHTRFAFDPTFANARFVIVDDLWRNWAVYDVAGLADELERVQSWPMVFEAGAVSVYERPTGQ